jgi:hypothetical protein
MNLTKRTLIIAGVAAFVLPGCKKDEPTPLDLGYGYFPTRIGHWIEYDVDSAWIDELNNRQGQVSYPLRETLESDFTDPEGRPAERILRELKDSLGNWGPKDVWWQVSNSQRAERAEENLRKIKLVFPVREDQTWNTNAYNTSSPLTLTYEEVDVPWSANGMSFDSTCLVVTTFVNNFVDTVRYNERYAKNVGLVYRQVDVSRTQYIYPPNNPPIPVTVGTYLRMTVVAFGD